MARRVQSIIFVVLMITEYYRLRPERLKEVKLNQEIQGLYFEISHSNVLAFSFQRRHRVWPGTYLTTSFLCLSIFVVKIISRISRYQ